MGKPVIEGQQVVATAPATVANVGPGFDVLGFALAGPGDDVAVSWSETPGVTITAISGDDDKLSRDPNQNCVGVVAAALLDAVGCERGIALELTKGLPLGSGMGSSAASSAAAALAVNALLGSPFSTTELVRFAMIGEVRACGTGHADNVAPAILGGIVLISSYDPLRLVELPCPPSLYYAVVNPHFALETSHSRSVLPKQIPIATSVKQSAALASLLSGFFTNDYDLIAAALVDYIAEPARFPLIPFSRDVKEAALRAGAINCNISGSGPSLFSLCPSTEIADEVASAMKGAFSAAGIASTTHTGIIERRPPEIRIGPCLPLSATTNSSSPLPLL